MFEGRRPVFLAILLILAGLASYFLAEPKVYDKDANYELSRAKGGKWEHHVISGRDLNDQAKGDKPMNQIISVALIGSGLAALAIQWRLSRR